MALPLDQLREVVAHLCDERGDELVDEGLLQTERSTKPGGPPQQSAEDVSSPFVRGQRAIRDRERQRTDMIDDDAHGHLVLAFVGLARDLLNRVQKGAEQIGIVIRILPLQDCGDAFHAHPGVYVLGREFFQAAVSFAVVLDKDEVPELHDLGHARVHQVRRASVGGQIDVDL